MSMTYFLLGLITLYTRSIVKKQIETQFNVVIFVRLQSRHPRLTEQGEQFSAANAGELSIQSGNLALSACSGRADVSLASVGCGPSATLNFEAWGISVCHVSTGKGS